MTRPGLDHISRGKQNAVLPQCPRTTPEHCLRTTPGSAGTLSPHYPRARGWCEYIVPALPPAREWCGDNVREWCGYIAGVVGTLRERCGDIAGVLRFVCPDCIGVGLDTALH